MEVNYLQIFLIDITFYLKHVSKLVFNVLMKKVKHEYNWHRRLKG